MRPEREARIAAEAAERVRDRSERKDALTEAKLDLGRQLRSAVAPGAERRSRLDPSAATDEQRERIDKGRPPEYEPEMTREERNRQMDDALRGAMGRTAEDRHEEAEHERER